MPRKNEGLDALAPTSWNPRTMTDWKRQALGKSLAEFGDLGGIVFNIRSHQLVGGNQRVADFKAGQGAFRKITNRLEKPDRCGTVAYGYVEANGTRYSYREVDWDEIKEKAANIAANQHGGDFDWARVGELLKEIDGKIDFDLTGFDGVELASILDNGKKQSPEEVRLTLLERFGVPPFSVLDARQGYWQNRKRAWIALGIQSELGRGANALDMSASMAGIPEGKARDDWNKERRDGPRRNGKKKILAKDFGQDLMKGEHVVGDNSKRLLYPKTGDTDFYAKKRAKEKELGRKLSTEEFQLIYQSEGSTNFGTSIFDPVLCELVCRWFCPPGGKVLDPFAGGSVRGIVAAATGHPYTGIDLSEVQTKANGIQWEIIRDRLKSDLPDPNWISGDSRKIDSLLEFKDDCSKADLIFSCPPYGDLEVYSDDESDLSAMDHRNFIKAYREIIAKVCSRLANNRLACFVVGDFRSKAGMLRNFVSETIDAFQSAGLSLYNEAILVTAVGSLPVRAGRSFEVGRKLGKTHQNVLVFLKGDQAEIRKWPLPEFGNLVVE